MHVLDLFALFISVFEGHIPTKIPDLPPSTEVTVSTLFEEIENQWVVSDSLDISLSEEKSIGNEDDDDENYHPPSELDVPAQVAAEPVDTTPDNPSNKKSKIPPMGKPCGPKCKRQCTQRVGKGKSGESIGR